MKQIWFVFFTAFIGLSASNAHAQQITPSHVFQAADSMVVELQALAHANYADSNVPSVPVDLNKRPRHVIQKSQQILHKLNILLLINGHQPPSVAPIPVAKITPENVLRPVSKALKEVRNLKTTFYIDSPDQNSALVMGKKPGHVYARLTQASILIGRLDVPKIVPNDVKRSALAIVADLDLLAKKLGVEKPQALGTRFSKKSPKDVYVHARNVLTTLKTLVESNDALKIPGSIIVPPEKTGKITPGDVLVMQDTILAELSSIKVVAGVRTSTPHIPPPSGNTPSHVYESTHDALLYVQAFLNQIPN